MKKAAAWDAAALLVFVVVGVVNHGATVGAFCRDLACILGGWFAAAIVLRLYVRGGRCRLAATWLVGGTASTVVVAESRLAMPPPRPLPPPPPWARL